MPRVHYSVSAAVETQLCTCNVCLQALSSTKPQHVSPTAANKSGFKGVYSNDSTSRSGPDAAAERCIWVILGDLCWRDAKVRLCRDDLPVSNEPLRNRCVLLLACGGRQRVYPNPSFTRAWMFDLHLWSIVDAVTPT